MTSPGVGMAISAFERRLADVSTLVGIHWPFTSLTPHFDVADTIGNPVSTSAEGVAVGMFTTTSKDQGMLCAGFNMMGGNHEEAEQKYRILFDEKQRANWSKLCGIVMAMNVEVVHGNSGIDHIIPRTVLAVEQPLTHPSYLFANQTPDEGFLHGVVESHNSYPHDDDTSLIACAITGTLTGETYHIYHIRRPYIIDTCDNLLRTVENGQTIRARVQVETDKNPGCYKALCTYVLA